jgi:VIT1/CCC1 family predicted Fe2+/Mn2+ transporter
MEDGRDQEKDSPAIRTTSSMKRAVIAAAVFVSAYCLGDSIQGKPFAPTKYVLGGLIIFVVTVVGGKLSSQSYR